MPPPSGHENETVANCTNAPGAPGLGTVRCNYGGEIENLDKLFTRVLAEVKPKGFPQTPFRFSSSPLARSRDSESSRKATT